MIKLIPQHWNHPVPCVQFKYDLTSAFSRLQCRDQIKTRSDSDSVLVGADPRMGQERRSGRVEQRRRRKIPLACEPCRERKSRCDGAKPICSTCQRRSLPLDHCIYTLENARTASNEASVVQPQTPF